MIYTLMVCVLVILGIAVWGMVCSMIVLAMSWNGPSIRGWRPASIVFALGLFVAGFCAYGDYRCRVDSGTVTEMTFVPSHLVWTGKVYMRRPDEYALTVEGYDSWHDHALQRRRVYVSAQYGDSLKVGDHWER